MRAHNPTVYWAPGKKLEELERDVIINAYAHYKENKTATAIALGICIRTLDNKLKIYQAEQEERDRLELIRKQEREEFLARCRGKTSTPIFEAESGSHMESLAGPTPELEVPLSESEEIQGVLHEQVTTFGAKRGRQGLSRANG